MRKRTLVAAVAIILVSACKSTPGDTGYHLPADVMQRVLTDASMAEAYSTITKDSKHMQGTKNFDSLAVYYRIIFDHYHITGQQFEQSIQWYKQHTDKLDTMSGNIIPTLTTLQNKANDARLKTAPPPPISGVHTGLPNMMLRPGAAAHARDSAGKKQ